ncbi:hypothetical protein J2T21_000280 [Paeniglutamicibacter psychrophenolicus]|nr:hypothetical protein [Paeniglutamicibacter psychrophenolicus]
MAALSGVAIDVRVATAVMDNEGYSAVVVTRSVTCCYRNVTQRPYDTTPGPSQAGSPIDMHNT